MLTYGQKPGLHLRLPNRGPSALIRTPAAHLRAPTRISSLSNRASPLLCHAVCISERSTGGYREKQEQKHASHLQQGCLLGSGTPLGAGHLAEDMGLSGTQPYISQGKCGWSQRPLSLQHYHSLCQTAPVTHSVREREPVKLWFTARPHSAIKWKKAAAIMDKRSRGKGRALGR